MAFWLTELETALYDRIVADTATGGLFGTGAALLAAHPNGSHSGVYNTIIPEANSGTVYPAVTFMVSAASNDDSLRTASRNVRVNIAVEVQRTGPSGATQFNPLVRGAAILQRIEGNWYEKSAGTAPDYGLERWRPTLAGTTWESDILTFESFATVHDNLLFRWELSYTVGIHRAGA
jgi:hypothetical protein